MTSRSGPGQSRGDRVLSVIVSERHRVISLACRLLGWLAGAEDTVRESSARWHAMSAQRREAIGPAAAGWPWSPNRIGLDLLGSARARRERAIGSCQIPDTSQQWRINHG
jgi:RNA polymerase sigma-70 factor (ECF subfamily)